MPFKFDRNSTEWSPISSVPFDDPALQIGALGFFETLAVSPAGIELFDAHMLRLTRSLEAAEILWPCNREELIKGTRKEIAQFEKDEWLRLRITVLPDTPQDGKGPRQLGRIWIHARPLDTSYRTSLQEREPMSLAVFEDFTFGNDRPFAGMKSAFYFPYAEARRRIRLRGADEAILCDTNGNVVEASAFNIFWINDGKVLSPSHHLGALPGIGAQKVRQLAVNLGYECADAEVPISELVEAETVFLTNSLAIIAPVSSIEYSPAKADAHTLLPETHMIPDVRKDPIGKQLVAQIEATRASWVDVTR